MSGGSIGRRSHGGVGDGEAETIAGESEEGNGPSLYVEQSSSTTAGGDVEGEAAEEEETYSEG